MNYELVLMDNGRISSPTLHWTNNPAEMIRAYDKCRNPQKQILRIVGDNKIPIHRENCK